MKYYNLKKKLNCFFIILKHFWNCSEIALKLLWNCVKTAPKLLLNWRLMSINFDRNESKLAHVPLKSDGGCSPFFRSPPPLPLPPQPPHMMNTLPHMMGCCPRVRHTLSSIRNHRKYPLRWRWVVDN